MNRLEDEFSDRIDFFVLDVDNPDARPYMTQFLISRRSSYVLIDAAGNELTRWIGPLDGDAVAAQLEEILATLN